MIDHIVLAVQDVQAAVEEIADATGVRAELGGRFEGRGVYNHLLALQDGAYLEIIGPDPQQPGHEGPLPFGLHLDGQRRVPHWCAKAGADIEQRVAAAREAGYDIGEVRPLGRVLADGTRLDWRLSVAGWPPLLDGLVPFLIDWGTATHPSTTAVQGCTLIDFHGEHPDPPAVQTALQAAAATLEVRQAETPALSATLEGPKGRITLR